MPIMSATTPTAHGRLATAAGPLLASMVFAASLGAQAAPSGSAELEARARAIHERVLTLDTHVDINPTNFRADAPNYTQRLPRTQVDLVKMREGGLDAAFLIVYVGQTPQLNDSGYARAHAQAMEKFAAIHRLVDTLAPDRVGLARSAADARCTGGTAAALRIATASGDRIATRPEYPSDDAGPGAGDPGGARRSGASMNR